MDLFALPVPRSLFNIAQFQNSTRAKVPLDAWLLETNVHTVRTVRARICRSTGPRSPIAIGKLKPRRDSFPPVSGLAFGNVRLAPQAAGSQRSDFGPSRHFGSMRNLIATGT